MANSIGSINSSAGIVPSPLAPAPAAPSSSAAFTHATLPASFENPRVIQDPTAGYIVEYLSSVNGQIISQSPSAVTVAYLRDGLQADGTPKHTATTA